MKSNTYKSTSAVVSSVLVFFLMVTVKSGAQSNKLPTPHDPLLPNAPEMAAWTITFQYPSNDSRGNKKTLKTPKDRITSIEIEKTGNTYRKITHYDTGTQSEAWSVNNREVMRENEGTPFVPTPSGGPIADDYSKSDFEDLDWLNMKCYVGLEKGDHPGFVFRAKYKNRQHTRREKLSDAMLSFSRVQSGNESLPHQIESPTQDNPSVAAAPQLSEIESTIVLDSKTQMPLSYDQGPVKWSYQFLAPPTSALVLPPEVDSILAHWDTFIKASESSASPP